METKEINIRTLTVADSRVLVGLLSKLLKSGYSWVGNIVTIAKSSGNEGEERLDSIEKYYQIFESIIGELTSNYVNDLTEWFASLVGVSVDDYQKLPIESDLIVIEQLKSSGEFKSFFLKACAVFSLKEKFQNLISNAKKKFDSLTD